MECEPSVSFDYSKSEMNSMERKMLNRVLEVKEEHPKKQLQLQKIGKQFLEVLKTLGYLARAP